MNEEERKTNVPLSFKPMKNLAGKFIVLDGTDGSGKETQTNILVEKLSKLGYNVKKADFPQYGKKSAGAIEEYLNGKYGSAKAVGPYRASIFYAIDRYDASKKINKWLAEGNIVISNRYLASNLAHQGGKITDHNERKQYFDWLENLEYNIFGIQKPDLNIILHVEPEISQALVDKKDSRSYINGAKRDIHEADIKHLKEAEQVYLELTHTYPDFELIKCTDNNQILPKGVIADLIWHKISNLLEPITYHNYNPNYNITNKSENRFEHNLIIQRMNPNAKLPVKAYKHDAGFDIFSPEVYSITPNAQVKIRTGIKMAIPNGYVGLIWDKSGVANNGIHALAGVIDSGFRGEVCINLINLGDDIYNISPGQKIAQILIQKIESPQIIEDEIDDETERDEGAYGSSGLF